MSSNQQEALAVQPYLNESSTLYKTRLINYQIIKYKVKMHTHKDFKFKNITFKRY